MRFVFRFLVVLLLVLSISACGGGSGATGSADSEQESAESGSGPGDTPGADETCETSTYYEDKDGDGFGSDVEANACEVPDGYVTNSNDCDDSKTGVNPSASESCSNNIDDDCDGSIDEDCSGCTDGESKQCGTTNVGVCEYGTQTCSEGVWGTCSGNIEPEETDICDSLDNDCDGTVDENCDSDGDGSNVINDCDDTNADVYPGNSETCDGLDNDCDDDVDEGVTTTYYRDRDGDGYGYAPDGTEEACVAPNGYVEDAGDCDPDLNDVYPGAPEICEGALDNDCSGGIDEGCDCTNDSQRSCGTDVGICEFGTQTCSSGTWGDCIGAVEAEENDIDCDGLDNDCNGTADDGYVETPTTCGVGECSSAGSLQCIAGSEIDSCSPGASSPDTNCNGLDEDCDGTNDEHYVSQATSCGVGACESAGTTSCVSGVVVDSCVAGESGTEICDAGLVDEDCDSSVNENCDCINDDTQQCGDTDVGICEYGTQTCVDGAWAACQGAVFAEPLDDDCNGLDDDCNGIADDEYSGVSTECGVGACASTGEMQCIAGVESDTCVAGDPVAEVCEGLIDGNCNGVADLDDGCECVNDSTQSCGTDVGECVAGIQTCVDGAWGSCVGSTGSQPEVCDGAVDEDCDGLTDANDPDCEGVDLTPPQLTGVVPEMMAVDVEIDQVVRAVFNENLDCSTVTTDSFRLELVGDTWVSGSIQNCGGGVVEFHPDANLEYDTQYAAELTPAITDLAGNNLAGTYMWTFTTAAEPVGWIWKDTTQTGVSAARYNHTTVVAGNKIIVWGGRLNTTLLTNTGSVYDVENDSWTAMTTDGAPSAREGHTAVWDTINQRMIIYGGTTGSTYYGDCTAYDPSTDTWIALNTNDGLNDRAYHTAIWTGSQMWIWGGKGPSSSFYDGSKYDAINNTWALMSTSGLTTGDGRDHHTAVWTGSLMITWGGLKDGGYADNMVHKYNGAAWSEVNAPNAPLNRKGHIAVWTGQYMFIWGGERYGTTLGDGGLFNPVLNQWSVATTTGAPTNRYLHSAVWNVSEVIIFGGQSSTSGGYLSNGARYSPDDYWVGLDVTDGPTARSLHSAAWLDSLGYMVVWGGKGNQVYNTGALYDPSNDIQ